MDITHTHIHYYIIIRLYYVHYINIYIIINSRGGHVYTAAGACVIKRFIVVRTAAVDEYETCC